MKVELSFPGGLMLLVIRAFALWIYVPVGLLVGVFTFPWLLRLGATAGEYLGWLDINFCYLLLKSILKPLVRGVPPTFIPVAGIPSVKHRIGYLDAY